MKKGTRIYLTGFMGSGKSSVGKLLAENLGFGFTDLDDLIRKKIGMSISDYFRNNGQTEFRKLEKEILEESFLLDNHVIACGGGTPCFFDNMERMLENGLVIYLKVSEEQLQQRLQGSENIRPVLKEVLADKKEGAIKELLRERELFYNRAHVAVDAGKSDIAHLSTALMKIVEKWRRCPSILYT